MPIVGLFKMFNLVGRAVLLINRLIRLGDNFCITVICVTRNCVHLGETRGLSFEFEVAMVLVGIVSLGIFLCRVILDSCRRIRAIRLGPPGLRPELESVTVLQLLLVVDGCGWNYRLLLKVRLTSDELIIRLLMAIGSFREWLGTI